MSRRYVWPLIGLFAVALTPQVAPAKPGDGGFKPSSPAAVPLPSNKHKLTAPPCKTPAGSKQIYIPANRRGTKMKTQYSIGTIGETIKLRATLTTEDGLKVAFQSVEFKVDNQVVGTAKTNSKGEASLDFKVPNKFGPKPVVARFAGNQKCDAASDSSTLGTVRSPTTIYISAIKSYANVNHETHFRGNLKRNSDGGSISGRELEIYAQGKKIATVLTDTHGQFAASYTPTSGAGKPLEYKAQFVGDVLYNPTIKTESVMLYPPRQTVYLMTPDVVARYGQTVNAAVIVKIGNPVFGSKYVGAKVHASRERGRRWAPPRYDKRHLGTGTSNNLGIAYVPFKVMEDVTTYHLWVSADAPRERYDVKQQPEAKLKVLKSPVKLSISGPGSVHVGESASFDVTVRRTTDSLPVDGVTVCAKNIKCAETNAQGKATLTFTIPGGSTGARAFTFESRADDHHLAGAKDLSVQALPSIN